MHYVVWNHPASLRSAPLLTPEELVLCGDELKTKFFGLSCQISHRPLFVLLFISVLADIGIFFAEIDQAVDQQSQFVCSRDDGFFWPQARAHATRVGPQSTVAVEQCLCAQTQQIANAIRRFARPTLKDSAASDFVVGT